MADITANRNRGNPESAAANAKVEPSKTVLQVMIWEWFLQQARHGGTTEECSRALGIRYTTASARISELKAEGWLVRVVNGFNGKPILRKTSTGSSAGVFRGVSKAERKGEVFPTVQRELFT